MIQCLEIANEDAGTDDRLRVLALFLMQLLREVIAKMSDNCYKASGKSKNNKFYNSLLDAGIQIQKNASMSHKPSILEVIATDMLRLIGYFILGLLFLPLLVLLEFLKRTVKSAYK